MVYVNEPVIIFSWVNAFQLWVSSNKSNIAIISLKYHKRSLIFRFLPNLLFERLVQVIHNGTDDSGT